MSKNAVYAKLLEAVKKVGGEVPKTGYNSFSKYKYITESDINKAVLPALLEQGLLLTTSVKSLAETASGPESKNRFATVILNHKIIDAVTGDFLELESAGTAADTLDKAIYKAYTGACKYFMMKLFLISGDDSDPENDSGSATTSAPKAAQPSGVKVASQQPAKQTQAPMTAPVKVAPQQSAPQFGAKPSEPQVQKQKVTFGKTKPTGPMDFGAPALDAKAITTQAEKTVDDIPF